jgi:hypothetical protein
LIAAVVLLKREQIGNNSMELTGWRIFAPVPLESTPELR